MNDMLVGKMQTTECRLQTEGKIQTADYRKVQYTQV